MTSPHRHFTRRLPGAAWLALAAAVLSLPPAPTWAQATTGSGDAAAQAPSAETRTETRPELKDLLPQQRLVGKTRLTVWGFQVYDARLWAAPGVKAEQLPSQPFALELAYLREFDNTDIAERSIKEMRRSAAIGDAQAAAWTADMLRIFPNVKRGDRLMGVNQPGKGVLFFVNGKPGGEIRDVEFARLFFGIWLSDKTSEPQMRDALLAGAV